MALHSQMGARGVDDKPLPSLPSPTLTNPDMVGGARTPSDLSMRSR